MKQLRSVSFLLPLLIMMACGSQIALAQSETRILYATVVDKAGAPVPNLTEKDFIVREDGQAREILGVTPDNDPLQVALLIDTSGGMQNNVSDLRRAVAAFVENIRPGADIALITLGDRPTISVPYTADRARLKKGIDSLFAVANAGNTLVDGIAETAQGLLKKGSGHAAIAAISGSADLSFRQYEEVLRTLHASGAVLHVLTLGATNGGSNRELTVGKGTEDTGGLNETVLSSMGLQPKAAALAVMISSQYRITFARPERLIPPKSTDVSVKNPDLTVHGILLKTAKERE